MGLLLDGFRKEFRACGPSDGQWRAISRYARIETYKALIARHSAEALRRHLCMIVAILDEAERAVKKLW